MSTRRKAFAKIAGLTISFFVGGCTVVDEAKIQSALVRDIPVGSNKETVERVLNENGFHWYFEKDGILFIPGDHCAYTGEFYKGYIPENSIFAQSELQALVLIKDEKATRVIVQRMWMD